MFFLGRLLSFGLVGAFWLFTPAHAATSKGDCRRELTRSAHLPPTIPDRITLDWLKQNMLFGPEVTFTSEIIWGLDAKKSVQKYLERSERPHPREQKFKGGLTPKNQKQILAFMMEDSHSPLTSEQAHEILRFLRDVVRAESGTMTNGEYNTELRGRDGKPVSIHTNNGRFTFAVTTLDGLTLTVNLEPGVLEVNQPPQLFDEILPAWTGIFERAKQAGFTESLEWMSSGGGGHLHLGFKDKRANLFWLRPHIVADLVELPLKQPALLLAFRGLDDFQTDSTSVIPSERMQRLNLGRHRNETILRTILNTFRIISAAGTFRAMNALRHLPQPDLLYEHDAATSFKKYLERGSLEIRYLRPYTSAASIHALAELYLRIVLRSAKYFYGVDHFDEWRTPEELNPTNARREFSKILNELHLSQFSRAALAEFTQESLLTPHQKLSGSFGYVTTHIAVPASIHARPHHEIAWNFQRIPNRKKLHSVRIGSLLASPAELKRGIFRFDAPEAPGRMLRFPVFFDSKQGNLATYVLEIHSPRGQAWQPEFHVREVTKEDLNDDFIRSFRQPISLFSLNLVPSQEEMLRVYQLLQPFGAELERVSEVLRGARKEAKTAYLALTEHYLVDGFKDFDRAAYARFNPEKRQFPVFFHQLYTHGILQMDVVPDDLNTRPIQIGNKVVPNSKKIIWLYDEKGEFLREVLLPYNFEPAK